MILKRHPRLAVLVSRVVSSFLSSQLGSRDQAPIMRGENVTTSFAVAS